LEVAQALEPYAAGNHVTATTARSTADVAHSGRGRPSSPLPLDQSDDLNLNRFLRALAHEAEIDSPADTLAGARPTILEQRPEPARGAKTHGHGRVVPHTRASRRARQWGLLATAIILLLALGAWGWERAGRTQLVIDWPVSEREEGTLEIDGVPQE